MAQLKSKGSTPVRRVAILVRASTQELADAETLRQQENICREYADLLTKQTGVLHKVVRVFIEEGVSGASKKRPQFDELKKMVKSKEIDDVITKELTRLSRSIQDFSAFSQLCKDHGVSLHITNLPDLNPNTATGSMVLSVLASIAVFERDICVERVKGTLRSAALKDSKINGGSVIYGFKRNPTKKGFWIPVDSEIKNIEFMMKTFIEVGGITETIDIAYQNGIVNKNGKKFTCTALRKLFENKKLIGQLRVIHGDNDELEKFVPLDFGAVIDIELFEKVQKQLIINDSARLNQNRRGKRVYLFTGLLENEAGATFSGTSCIPNNEIKKSYYIESKSKTRIDADKLEDKVLKNLCSTIETKTELEKHSKTLSNAKNQKITSIDTEIKQLRAELIKNEKKESDIVHGISALGNNAPELTIKFLNDQISQTTAIKKQCGERLEALNQELANLTKTEVDLKKFQKQALKTFLQMRKANRIQLRQFLRQIIEKIEICVSGEVRIIWKFSEVFTPEEGVVVPTKNWLRRRDSNPRPSG